MSSPAWSNMPPFVPKSFCMSTTITAVFGISMVMGWHLALMIATSFCADCIGVILFGRILALERQLSDLSCEDPLGGLGTDRDSPRRVLWQHPPRKHDHSPWFSGALPQ